VIAVGKNRGLLPGGGGPTSTSAFAIGLAGNQAAIQAGRGQAGARKWRVFAAPTAADYARALLSIEFFLRTRTGLQIQLKLAPRGTNFKFPSLTQIEAARTSQFAQQGADCLVGFSPLGPTDS